MVPEKRITFKCDNIGKVFHSKAGHVTALEDVCLCAWEEEFISIVGPSGCGKTTLLKIIAGLQTPTRGTVEFNDQVIDKTYSKSHQQDLAC